VSRPAVWAPAATRVELVVEQPGGQRRAAMLRADVPRGGWWRAADDLPAGTDYRFSVEGGEPLPDPRSRWQPLGVHGPSRIFDPGELRWHDQGWQPPALADGLVYEAHVGTLSGAGTFAGAIEHLDYLVELGVTHLELMPVAEFPGRRGWGYDGVHLYAPHHDYGGPAGLGALVDACHARGLAVILDVVYNHLGPDGNYLSRFGPYFTDRYSTPWGDAVNLDGPGSDEVRRFFVDNALAWLRDYHLDGLRIDAVHAIFDTSAVHFLEQLAAEVHALGQVVGRRLLVVAESDLNDPRLITPVERGGYGLDAAWSDDFHHALHALLTGEQSGYYADFGRLDDLAICLTRGYRYAGDYSNFRQRRHGRPNPDLDGRRLLGYLQNHDQVGNRAAGERGAQLMSSGRLMIGAAMVLTAPFVPMLFQGEEWAAATPFQYFTQHSAELGRLVSEGRRAEFAAFGWRPEDVPDPQAPETFKRSRLDWSERERPEHARVLDWYRRLIALRRSHPELRDGRLDQVIVEYDAQAGWLSLVRGGIAIVVNIGDGPAELGLPGRGRLLLGSQDAVSLEGAAVHLPADSVAVVELDHPPQFAMRSLGN
jgi:maltooligosyltrehalose trehalohydrolase